MTKNIKTQLLNFIIHSNILDPKKHNKIHSSVRNDYLH